MGLRETKTEEIKNAHHQVELPRNPQVEQKVRDQILEEISDVVDLGGGQCKVIIDEAIEQQMEETASDPIDADLIGLERVLIEVIASKRLVIDDGKQREARIGKHEKVRQRAPRRRRLGFMTQVVHVYDEAEHEHRAQNRPDRLGPRGQQPTCPFSGEDGAYTNKQSNPQKIRDRQVTNGDKPDADSYQPHCILDT